MFIKDNMLSIVYRERLKLYLFSLLRNPAKFSYRVFRKLFNEPSFFLKLIPRYFLKETENQHGPALNLTKKTEGTYGFLWKEIKNTQPEDWHYNSMQDLIKEPIVRGVRGIDIGSGCGYDTYIMAKNNPLVKIVSLEISAGVYKNRQLTSGLENVWIIRGSALNIPIADATFDFAYSFGVLHHTTDPAQGVREIARVIKKMRPHIFIFMRITRKTGSSTGIDIY